MFAVGDQFDGHPVGQIRRLDDPAVDGLPLLMLGSRTAIQVGNVREPLFVERKGRFGVRGAVPRGGEDPALPGPVGEQIHPGQLRRGVETEDMPARKRVEFIQFLLRRDFLLRDRLRALRRGGEIGSLEVNAENFASVFRRAVLNRATQPFHPRVQRLVRAGQGGREERGGPVTGVQAQNRADRVGVVVEKIVSAAAVHVEIDEPGQNVSARGVDDFRVFRDGFPPLGDPDDRFVKQQDFIGEDPIRRDENAVHDGFHFLL